MGLQDLSKVVERAWGLRWSMLLNHSFSLQATHSSAPLFTHSFSNSEYNCKFRKLSNVEKSFLILVFSVQNCL